jgi:protein involved in polysaccharide export with SLBB domain
MAALGQAPQFVMPPLRTRTVFKDHGVHRDHMVAEDGETLNIHLAFAPGLTPSQSRAIVRDMEREQRRIASDADRQRAHLARQKELAESAATASTEQSELMVLSQRLFAISGRLQSKAAIAGRPDIGEAAAATSSAATRKSAAPPADAMTREERLAALLGRDDDE